MPSSGTWPGPTTDSAAPGHRRERSATRFASSLPRDLSTSSVRRGRRHRSCRVKEPSRPQGRPPLVARSDSAVPKLRTIAGRRDDSVARGTSAVAAQMLGRPTGTGTRTLLDRLLLDAGVDPDAVSGPTVELHLDVALAVATGEAAAGLGLRSAATALGLDFVPLSWEPFQVATTRAQTGGLAPPPAAPPRAPASQPDAARAGDYRAGGGG